MKTNRTDGLTSFDLKSAEEPERGRSTGSAKEVIMADRKERRGMTRRTRTHRHRETRQRDVMPEGVHSYQRVTTEKRRDVPQNRHPAENAAGDPNQKTAITSQMALTSHGFERHFLVIQPLTLLLFLVAILCEGLILIL